MAGKDKKAGEPSAKSAAPGGGGHVSRRDKEGSKDSKTREKAPERDDRSRSPHAPKQKRSVSGGDRSHANKGSLKTPRKDSSQRPLHHADTVVPGPDLGQKSSGACDKARGEIAGKSAVTSSDKEKPFNDRTNFVNDSDVGESYSSQGSEYERASAKKRHDKRRRKSSRKSKKSKRSKAHRRSPTDSELSSADEAMHKKKGKKSKGYHVDVSSYDSDSDSDSENSDPRKFRVTRPAATSTQAQCPCYPGCKQTWQPHGADHAGSWSESGECGSSDESDSEERMARFIANNANKGKPQNGTAPVAGMATTVNFQETLAGIETFFETGDKTGQDVHKDFASIFNDSLRRRPNDKRLIDTMDKYNRPGNVPNLAVPKTNDIIWEKMNKGPQIVDAGMQKVQTIMSKAMVPIVNMVSGIGDGTLKDTPLQDYLTPLTDVMRLGFAAFSLMNQSRRDVIRNDMKYPINKLCHWKYPVGQEHLFGEDVLKMVKEMKEQSKHMRFAGGFSGHSHGYRSPRKPDYTQYHRSRPSFGHHHYKARHQGFVRRKFGGGGFKKFKKNRPRDQGKPTEVCQLDKPISVKRSNNEDNLVSKLKNTPDNFSGGKLSTHIDAWMELTSDKWILDTIRGYTIEFDCMPQQTEHERPNPVRMSKSEQLALDAEIQSFIDYAIIEPCIPNENDSFYSNLFTRSKKDGSLRVILNLKHLTPYLEKRHFKMETVKDIMMMMRPNCLFASIDFKHAFFSVKIRRKDRKFLRFVWNGKHYQFTCLPQGLGPASRVFTKILKPAFAHLRSRGLEIAGYIDDSMCVSDDAEDFASLMMYAVKLFDNLGFTINVAKSVLPPMLVQNIEHLGFIFNSADMTVQLTDKKKDCIQHLAKQLLKNSNHTIRELATFTGKLVAAEPGFAEAPIYYKEIESYKNMLLAKNRGNYDAVFEITVNIRKQIEWWQNHVHHTKRHMITPDPEHVIESDASNTGWGGVINGQKTARGQWSEQELNDHINIRELQAAFFMLKTFCKDKNDTHIRLKLDNTTSVACINRMASTKPHLMSLTREIWLWAAERNIHLSAEYLPGKYNVDADAQSRVTENLDTEWMLKSNIFRDLCKIFGTPSTDMFASRINKQLATYVSWRPDPEAMAVDAFAQSWHDQYIYAFPPFSLIARVMQKVRRERASVLLIAPMWPTQAWFATALGMLVATPVILPASCLILPQDTSRVHPIRSLRMAAMKLSGSSSLPRDYRRTLSILSQNHGELEQITNIGAISTNGCNFVFNGKLIPFHHL